MEMEDMSSGEVASMRGFDSVNILGPRIKKQSQVSVLLAQPIF
jgi:hypothetical protein